jgi:hypothetical protein
LELGSRSRVRWLAFAASLSAATFAVGAFVTEVRAASRTASACDAYVDSTGVSLAEGVAFYLPKSNQTNYQVVATDLRDVLVEVSKRDSRFHGYAAGPVEAREIVRFDPSKVETERGTKRLASASLFSFGKRPEAGMILVCHTSGESLTIAADGQAAAHLPVLRSIATSFLKADRIAAAGETIWPPKKGFKP